jgi:hypothetical protein
MRMVCSLVHGMLTCGYIHGTYDAYKDMLDNVVSPITCLSMNHQNQLEQMANGAMFATRRRLRTSSYCTTLYSNLVGWWSVTRVDQVQVRCSVPNDASAISSPT